MPRKPQTLIRDLNRAKDKLAKLRDELREIFDEAEDLAIVSGDAVESLEYAIDELSGRV